MQQSTAPMMPGLPSFPSANITTEQIQKCLDENKKLILAILDNQNLGKLAECAQYQAQLQKNLMYLAAIADAQPQMATMPPQPPQMSPHPAMQQGAYYMQQQTTPMGQQPGIFPPRMPTQFPGMHEHQQPPIPGQMNFRPTGPVNSSAGGPPTSGNKQDGPDSAGDHGQGSSGEGEPAAYMRGSEEGK